LNEQQSMASETALVDLVEVLQGDRRMLPEKKVEFSNRHLQAREWSATALCRATDRELAVVVVAVPTEWELELIVTDGAEDWRNHQVAGLLSRGSLYTNYGAKAPASCWLEQNRKVRKNNKTSWWHEEGRTAAVRLDRSQCCACFFVDGKEVAKVSLGSVEAVDRARLAVRAHKSGGVRLLDN